MPKARARAGDRGSGATIRAGAQPRVAGSATVAASGRGAAARRERLGPRDSSASAQAFGACDQRTSGRDERIARAPRTV
ncbi:MAG: hypothetical protein ACK52I_25920 [Pseudomonadota bacterium]